MPRLVNGLEQIFTNLGIVATGYKLFFFETTTTTPKTTYSDEGLTIQNPNPVECLASGRPEFDIWGFDPATYKLVLGTPDSVIGNINPIRTLDPIDDLNSGGINDAAAYWGATTGTSTNYILDPTLVPVTSYSDRQCFFIDFHTTCGVAPVININNLGQLDLLKYTAIGTTTALEVDDLLTRRYIAINNGIGIVILDPQKPFFDSRNLSRASEALVGVTQFATLEETQARVIDDKAISPKNFGLAEMKYLLVTQTITSAVATVEFDTLINSDYQQYQIEIINLKGTNDGGFVEMQISDDDGLTWKGGAADYSYVGSVYVSSGGLINPFEDTSASYILISAPNTPFDLSNDASASYQATIVLNTPFDNILQKIFRTNASYLGSSSELLVVSSSGSYKGSTNPINGIRFLLSSGNIASGIFKLYGLK